MSDPFHMEHLMDIADQVSSVFTLGLTKYDILSMDRSKAHIDSSCAHAVEALPD